MTDKKKRWGRRESGQWSWRWTMINIQSDQIMAGPRVITTAKKQKTKLDLMSMQKDKHWRH